MHSIVGDPSHHLRSLTMDPRIPLRGPEDDGIYLDRNNMNKPALKMSDNNMNNFFSADLKSADAEIFAAVEESCIASKTR